MGAAFTPAEHVAQRRPASPPGEWVLRLSRVSDWKRPAAGVDRGRIELRQTGGVVGLLQPAPLGIVTAASASA